MTIKRLEKIEADSAYIEGKKYDLLQMDGVDYLVRMDKPPGQVYRVMGQEDIEGVRHTAVEIEKESKIEKIIDHYMKIVEMPEMEDW